MRNNKYIVFLFNNCRSCQCKTQINKNSDPKPNWIRQSVYSKKKSTNSKDRLIVKGFPCLLKMGLESVVSDVDTRTIWFIAFRDCISSQNWNWVIDEKMSLRKKMLWRKYTEKIDCQNSSDILGQCWGKHQQRKSHLMECLSK